MPRTFIPPVDVTPRADIWEAAYRRFETPEQEVSKFMNRLQKLGADAWPRNARIVELFCGRGNGLLALSRLGFTEVTGIDYSPALVSLYQGPGQVVVGDCRKLPWEDRSKDILIAQGGLHHLPELPSDCEQVLAEACRVLDKGGRFVAVEPWLTPFLQFVHWTSFSSFRRLSKKLDAFATMTEHEKRTYESWLLAPHVIRSLLERFFEVEQLRVSFGKIWFVGVKRRT